MGDGTVVGIDMGGTTGVCRARVDGGRLVSLEHWSLDIPREARSRSQKYEACAAHIDRATEGADRVYFEDVRHFVHFTYVAFMLGYLATVCIRFDVPARGINVSTLKKWAVKGSATKEQMVAAASMRLQALDMGDPHLLTHDQADAVLVCLWGLAEEGIL